MSTAGGQNTGSRLLFVVLTLVVSLGIVGLADHCDMWTDPDVIADVSTDAISLSLAAPTDLVRAARPRYGLNPDRSFFNGLSLRHALDPVTVEASLGPLSDTRGNALSSDELAPLGTLAEFRVDPRCRVWIEQLAARWVRMEVLADQPGDAAGEPCTFLARFQESVDTPSIPRSAIVFDTVRPDTSRILQFRPAELHTPLILRRFPVTQLDFLTKEGETPRTAVRSGVIDMPFQGVTGLPIHPADSVTMGEVRGSLVQLSLADSSGGPMRALFRGSASDPRISGESVKPSLLQAFMYSEWRLAGSLLVVILGILGLVRVRMPRGYRPGRPGGGLT